MSARRATDTHTHRYILAPRRGEAAALGLTLPERERETETERREVRSEGGKQSAAEWHVLKSRWESHKHTHTHTHTHTDTHTHTHSHSLSHTQVKTVSFMQPKNTDLTPGDLQSVQHMSLSIIRATLTHCTCLRELFGAVFTDPHVN